jgi:hypothetical protein
VTVVPPPFPVVTVVPPPLPVDTVEVDVLIEVDVLVEEPPCPASSGAVNSAPPHATKKNTHANRNVFMKKAPRS